MTRSQLIIVTDLDGTLLDQKSYSYQASLPAIQRVKSLEIPLILCSSKTRSEMAPLWQELGLKDPFIVENGGAICLPLRYFPFAVSGAKSQGPWETVELGTVVAILRRRLEEAARECSVQIKTLAAMGLDEISRLTGLSEAEAALAAQREYDEPFVVLAGEREKLFLALRKKGLGVTHGDRLHHLTGGHGKGEAVKLLLDLYRRRYGSIFSVGLGNSANDLSLLSQVNHPILVRNPDGGWDREVMEKLPAVERTHGIGPDGWSEAVEKILTESA